MGVKIEEPPGNDKFVVPCEEGDCTIYKSQRSSRSQQEGSGSEMNPIRFSEESCYPS
jgi:hypothetical protein